VASDAPPGFRCEVAPGSDGDVTIRPIGELDLATADHVHEQLCALRAAGFAHVTLDLGRLTFIDSTGIRLLIVWTAEASADGWRLEMLPGSSSIDRTLELNGVRDRFFPAASS
jgi:anti-sigma B factor antagonist